MKKYKMIYQDLKKNIENGTYKIGSPIPAEKELTEKYEVSRETLRKSLELLSQNGYIQKRQGSNTIVLDYQKFNFPLSNLTSYSELNENQHLNSKTEIISIELDHANVDHSLYPFGDDIVWQSRRIRQIDGEKIILDKNYLNKDIVPNLTKKVLKNSLFKYIEQDLQLDIDYSLKEITVENATEEDEKYLDLDSQKSVVVVRSKSFLIDNRCFEYTESRHRADKFIFKEFARRKRINKT